MKKLFFKKTICSVLILSTLLPSVYLSFTSKAQAQGIPVIDAAHTSVTTMRWAWDKVVEYAEKYGRIAARLLARAILQQMIQETVNWINSGFEGSPMFMQNPGQFLKNSADIAAGEFIEGTALAFLCDPFKLDIKLNLNLKYGSQKTELGCTLSGVLGNIQGAYEDFVGGDFVGGGGWDSWMQMASDPMNNPQGAAMMAEGSLEVKIAGVKEIKLQEANWGLGALGLKKCEDVVKTEEDEYGKTIEYTEEVCKTVTPGATVMESLNLSQTSWIRTSELDSIMADGINAILGAFASQLIKMTLEKMQGEDGILGGGDSNVDYYADSQRRQSDAQNALDAQTEANNNAADAAGGTSNPLEQKRKSAITGINNLIDINKSHRKVYTDTKTTLEIARGEFISAKTCNINPALNGDDTSRANLIQTIFIDEIDGKYSTTTQKIPLSILQLDDKLQIVGNNISELEQILYVVTNAANEQEINAEMDKYNTLITKTKNIEPSSALSTYTANWLELRKNYSTTRCPINKIW